jgi:hypothetical protein
VIWEPWDAINFLCELVVVHDEDVEGGRVVGQTSVILDPGVRIGWNGPASMQWVWGVGLPVGLSHDSDPFGVFLYLSIEHAVTSAALAERRW